jgi:ABC-type Na+ transport system ATPase subunit NatA
VSPALTCALAPLLVLGARSVWLRAPARAVVAGSWVRGPAAVALAIAHALRLCRVEGVAALRGAIVAMLGGAVAALAARNGDYLEAPGFFLAVVAAPLVLAAASIVDPLREAERSLDVLLRSNGTSAATRSAGLVLAAGTAGTFFGLLALAAARSVTSIPAALDWAIPALGASIAPLVLAAERRARGRRGSDGAGSKIAITIMLLGAAVAVLAATVAELSVAVLAGAGVLAWIRRFGRLATRSAGPGGLVDLLSLRDLHKRFGSKMVLGGASLAVRRGQVAVLHGANGAGKSTVLRIAAGILEPDAGDVVVDGILLGGDRRALRSIGYAPDGGELPEHLSVAELVALVGALRGVAREDDEDRLGVEPLAAQRVSSLSLGQRRRVGLATAMIGRPAVLVLDEPTNGLDGDGLRALEEVLGAQRARGAAALVASHDASFTARIATAAFLLQSGAVSPLPIGP